MSPESVQQKFTAALDALVEQVKQDRSILAAILCGSLSHDTVWAKSDIDLVLVTIDDKKVAPSRPGALRRRRQRPRVPDAARASSARSVEGSLHNSFMHSLLAKGRLLYTHDETIADLCARLREIGERDTQMQLLRAATHALPSIYKAHKWFVTRGDLDYTALWILYAATPLAQIEVIERRPAGRPRGDPAGAEAEPGVLQDGLHRPAQREEDASERRRPRSTPSTRYIADAGADAVRAGDRAPARGRRGAVVHARSRITSSGTSTSAA